MALLHVLFRLMLIFPSCFDCVKLRRYRIPDLNITVGSEPENYDNVKLEVCKQKDLICKSDSNSVCAMRVINHSPEYKPFDNTCYLFLDNLCKYDGQEFHIVQAGSCDVYLKNHKKTIKRRINANNTESVTKILNNSTKYNETFTKTNKSAFGNNSMSVLTKSSLRSKTSKKPKYNIEDSFDDHRCPNSCPDVYSPVCMTVNRGEGKYFKYFTFINHCFGDMFYCKNYEDLGPAPTREYEDVQVSPLGWSFCGAYRYLQFARFSEVASSMGHYGWLAGDYRYSHIMEPHQRIPGHG